MSKAEGKGFTRRPRVFDGDTLGVRPTWSDSGIPPGRRITVGLGEPLDLEDSVELVFSRSRSNNLLIVGRVSESDNFDGAVLGGVHSCVAEAGRRGAKVTVVDLLDDSSNDQGLTLSELCGLTGAHVVRGGRNLGEEVQRLRDEVHRRQVSSLYDEPGELFLLHGLQRALDIAAYDPFATSVGSEFDEAENDESDFASVAPGVSLGDILRDGPDVGVHVAVTIDGLLQFERRLGKDTLREFGWRLVGSGVSPGDVAVLTDTYGESASRQNQLLLVDVNRGRNRRMKAYPPLTRSTMEKWGAGER